MSDTDLGWTTRRVISARADVLSRRKTGKSFLPQMTTWIEQLSSDMPELRAGGALAICLFSDLLKQTQRGAVASVLVGLLREADEKVGDNVCQALKKFPFEAFDAVMICIGSTSSLVRTRAVSVLADSVELFPSVAETLFKMLDDPSPEVRLEASRGLAGTKPFRPETLDRMLVLLMSSVPTDRLGAVIAIGRMEPDSVEERERCLAASLAAFRDCDPAVRDASHYAIEHLEPDVIRRYQLFLKAIEDPNDIVARSAVSIIRDIAKSGHDCRSAIPGLIQNLSRRDDVLRSGCCKALSVIGTSAPKVVPALIAQLQDPSPFLVAAAAQALWDTAKRVEESLPVIELHMQSHEIGVRERFCTVLFSMGTAARPLAGTLVNALDDPEWDLVWAATDALGEMRPSDPKIIRAIRRLRKHRSPIVRSAAERALEKIGGHFESSVLDSFTAAADRARELCRQAFDHIRSSLKR